MLTVGLGGVTQHGCVAVSHAGQLRGVCRQERISRVRNEGFTSSGLPDGALDALLEREKTGRHSIARVAAAEAVPPVAALQVEQIDHQQGHAAAAYLCSPFSAATVVVCDRSLPAISVWKAAGTTLTRIEWPWQGPGLAEIYAECAALFDADPVASGQRFDALARLSAGPPSAQIDALFGTDGHSIAAASNWKAEVERLRGAQRPPESAPLAAALQRRLVELAVEVIRRVSHAAPGECLCLGGSLFHHSAVNTAIARAGDFTQVFIPVDPGNAGLAVGTALHADGAGPRRVSPFLGPDYARDEVKATLDNCKVRYSWESEDAVVGTAVAALQQGLLVGWFEGQMEWGPRALGARSIVANPFSPYVLENLNRFLKRREPWRGYAMVGEVDAVQEHFDGPATAPYMEHDYRPREPRRFSTALPWPTAAVRVQTVSDDTPPRFRRLLRAFAEATGTPFLINTSFNAFREPIVCSPRDAVRVYYGSGLDMLVAEQFVLAK